MENAENLGAVHTHTHTHTGISKNIKNKGVTLIALIVTVIIMLILVTATVTGMINGELFNYAGKAKIKTEIAEIKEEFTQKKLLTNNLENGDLDTLLGRETGYNEIIGVDDGELVYYKDKVSEKQKEILEEIGINEKKIIEGHDGETFSGIYKKTKIYTEKSDTGEILYTAWIPKGFAVGTSEGINKISTGLVIRDENGNEFVWIPVTEDLGTSYTLGYYSEPKELTGIWTGSSLETNPKFDSQEILTELYDDRFIYSRDFNYTEEYEKMVEQVNKYNGFYIGRYETTIDEKGNIGSKYDTKVLTARDKFTYNETEYYYRWYGLYYAQKYETVTGNGTEVQTAMIYGVLWDKTMEFIRNQKEVDNTKYDVDTATSSWHRGGSTTKSGRANPTTESDIGDVALNIWDLESNAFEWTQMPYTDKRRALYGGWMGGVYCAAGRGSINMPDATIGYYSSRTILYIK